MGAYTFFIIIMTNTPASSPKLEFILLMAMLMSISALTIDAMLPALAQIGNSLGVEDPNDNQLIVGSVFLGMAIGLFLYGPISDSYGRKPAIFLGGGIFLAGCLLSIFAQNFDQMLVARVLQGAGAASCRVVTMAMIRDLYEGKYMAKVMSLILMMFILVPALAPGIGQMILFISPWQGIFIFLLGFCLIALIWLSARQPETLKEELRIPLSFSNLWDGIKQTLGHHQSRYYTFAAGIMFGAFVGYLATAQQTLQIHYGLGDMFAVYFGLLALAIGLSSFVNSKLVMIIPIEKLCILALILITTLSAGFGLFGYLSESEMPFAAFIIYLLFMFFGFGILFGNFNTLALHPLGHIAGVANSVITTVQTLLSVLIGTAIGQAFNDSVQPLIIGFMCCGLTSLILVLYTLKQRKSEEGLNTTG